MVATCPSSTMASYKQTIPVNHSNARSSTSAYASIYQIKSSAAGTLTVGQTYAFYAASSTRLEQAYHPPLSLHSLV